MATAEQATTEQKDFAKADEVREFTRGRLELLRIGGSDIGRLVLEPGWRWSEDVKPLAGTELCEAPHFQYHVCGTLRIETADGNSFDATPGQVTALRPVTTPGSSATSLSSSLTGAGPATTQKAERRI